MIVFTVSQYLSEHSSLWDDPRVGCVLACKYTWVISIVAHSLGTLTLSVVTLWMTSFRNKETPNTYFPYQCLITVHVYLQNTPCRCNLHYIGGFFVCDVNLRNIFFREANAWRLYSNVWETHLTFIAVLFHSVSHFFQSSDALMGVIVLSKPWKRVS